MRNAALDEAQAGIKITRRNINNLRYVDDTTLMAGSEEEVKSLLLRAKKLRSWHLVPWYMANRWGRSGNSGRFYFLVLQNYCGW